MYYEVTPPDTFPLRPILGVLQPPPSPLSPLSSPLPQIPSPPLPLPSPPTTSPSYAEARLGYKAAEIRLSVASPPTHHPSEIPSLPLFEVGESSATAAARQPGLDVATVDATPGCHMSREVGYGIEDVWDDMVGDMEERAPTTVEGLSQRVTDLSTTLAQDTINIYVRLEDSQDDRALQRARVNTLFRDRRYHLHTTVLVQTHETHIHMQDARIGSLETLVVTLVAQTSSLQTQLTTALGRIQTLEARELAHTNDPKDAGSSS
ncbi:hypothetical protein Tco_0812709 [Tanacetum coccineum]